MASEIRVNTINNRSGLGTISITNSGAVFSGVTTFAQIQTTSGEVTVGTGASVYSPATNVLALGTNNAERVRIDSSGNVGIGTDNPATPLHVEGNIRADGHLIARNPSATGQIFIQSDDNTYSASINVGGTGNGLGYTTGQLYFNSEAKDVIFNTKTSAGESLRITSGGLLLVGTNSDGTGRRLQVEGTDYSSSTFSVRRESADAGGSSIELYKSRGSSFNIVSNDDQLGYIRFYGSQGSADAEAARIRVDVDGSTSSSSMPGRLLFFTTPSGTTSPEERMRIDSSGNVRIANASSSAPLTVRGGSASASTIHMEGGVNGVDNARISCNQNLVLACNNAGNNSGRVIQFNNNTTTLATIDASANVSIENNGAILFKGNGSRAYFNDASASSVGTSSIGGSTATLFIGNAAIQVSSDVRLKENVEDTQIDALDAISRINVKDFTWNDPSDTSHNNRNARGKWTGLIAQELVEVLPFVVNAPRKEEDGSIDHDSESIWTLDQSQLCPVLIKAIQQQQEVIASQAATIASLDARLTALEG